ncbi:MAG: hypothetical protein HC902_02080, partial [Calothrix sp. SM1_5_4]|nr:hypothetical protein [Calothrix sp. SM1_5_4]
MFNSFIRLILSAAVLICGPLSCMPERKTIQDIYKVPTPHLVRAGGRVDLKTWSLQKDKHLDLHDFFDASAARPAFLDIQSNCRADGRDSSSSVRIVGGSPVPVFRILPEEYLATDLNALRPQCSFEFHIFNDAGSRHIFSFTAFKISDTSEARARLTNNGRTPSTSRWRHLPERPEGIKLRYANQAAASARILCQDFSLDPLPFDAVLAMDHFDFSGRASVERPIQLCRAVIAAQGELVALSPLFEVVLPRRPPAS